METAVVAPVIFLFIFAAIELSRAHLVVHSMKGAAHDGCRAGILDDATEEEVEQACEARLLTAGITEYEMEISPSALDTAEQWDPVTVTVTARYRDVSWLPVPDFLGDAELRVTSTLPREAEIGLTSQ